MTLPTSITVRSYSGVADLDAIDSMTAQLAHALHRIDLPWRLASPATFDPANIRLWESHSGQLVGWAILQFPWHCLDYEILPGPHRESVEQDVLIWATDRLTRETTRRGTPLPFYVSARSDDPSRIAAVHRAGFKSAGWSYVHMARDLREPFDTPDMPTGFRIRPLAGEEEVPAYVMAHRAAFGSMNMTTDWRCRTLRYPRYLADLDLVAEAPDGSVAAFCVGWLLQTAGGGHVAQVEPLGVCPEYQRLGLGRALLTNMFQRAREHGATRIEVNAESYNVASRGLYEAAGFSAQTELQFALRSFCPV